MINPSEKPALCTMDDKIRRLAKLAGDAADMIKQQSFVHLFTHNDTDGLTAAAIMIQALNRENIPYQHIVLSKIDHGIVTGLKQNLKKEALLIFCDIGSGQSSSLSKFPPSNPIIVLDHHVPVGESPAKIVVNPMTVGLEGANMISGAGVSYLVAKSMNPGNIDLSTLAVAGVVGDRQLMISANAQILDDAKGAGILTSRYGLKVGGGPLFDIFMTTTEPYLDITGNPDKINSFLSHLNLAGKTIEELTDEEMKRLTDAVLKDILEHGSPDAAEAVVGEIYYLKNQLVENVFDLSGILGNCGKDEAFDTAISLCLGDRTVLRTAWEIHLRNQKYLIESLSEAFPNVRTLNHISYVHGKDLQSAGEISTTYIRYVDPSKPFVCLNENEDIIKVSARGTRDLIQRGLNFSTAIKTAAEWVGGNGGGHNIASGGAIPLGSADAFLEKLDDLVGSQLNPNK
ncbi:DHH family phosphoesterase [Methanolapillus millepedarum]|uniref:DHH family phosphoesterase n=1 Tax=Methanolapillus millepedarum TaxID=3028296 RepID=A0AA96V4I9_9EURY|nr:hypothetical protein MsAc7_09450 [Methanosarcinaceae archaeon Ac7]